MMEPPIAALLGTAVGAVAGLAGPLVGGSLQAFRDRTKWRLDNQRDAYVNALQHLSNLINMRAQDAQPADVLAEVSRAQAALGMILIFCSEAQRARLSAALDALAENDESQELAKTYQTIVTCARNDLRHH